MPIPQPNPGEEKNAFIGRCVSFLADEDPNMDNKQRVAICQTSWNRSKEKVTTKISMHQSFIQILQDFMNLFSDGKKRFEDFVSAYRLDVNKSYGSQIKRECVNGLCEAFQWTKPFIKYWKEDDGGRYYKVRALTATVSANNNDYTDKEQLKNIAGTLTHRPLNINHDPSRMLPFPQNSVRWAEFEDNAVECVIRIDNSQANVQRQIESGDIVNPSIEALPLGGTRVDGRFVPEAYHFTALALLEKDETIPGVPTTFGMDRLFLNEDVAKRLVESIDWSKEELENEEKTNMSEEETKCLTHEPATKEEILEYWGIQGMSTCGQCQFFEITTPTNKTEPGATGDGVTTDSVNTSSVGFGLGVGKCKVLEKIRGTNFYVKHGDWACSDGRPRSDPITDNRPKQNAASHENIEVKAVETAYMKQVDELNEKLLDKDSQIDTEKREKAELRLKVTELTEQLSHAKRETNSKDTKVTTLTSDRVQLREQIDQIKDELADVKLKLERSQEDVEYHLKNTERIKEQYTEEKNQHSLTKDALERTISDKTEESVKRATAVQQAENDRDAKLKLLEENSLLTAKLAETQRSVTDYATNNSSLAKQVLELTNENSEVKKAHFELEETLKDTRRQLNQVKKRPNKIVLRT